MLRSFQRCATRTRWAASSFCTPSVTTRSPRQRRRAEEPRSTRRPQPPPPQGERAGRRVDHINGRAGALVEEGGQRQTRHLLAVGVRERDRGGEAKLKIRRRLLDGEARLIGAGGRIGGGGKLAELRLVAAGRIRPERNARLRHAGAVQQRLRNGSDRLLAVPLGETYRRNALRHDLPGSTRVAVTTRPRRRPAWRNRGCSRQLHRAFGAVAASPRLLDDGALAFGRGGCAPALAPELVDAPILGLGLGQRSRRRGELRLRLLELQGEIGRIEPRQRLARAHAFARLDKPLRDLAWHAEAEIALDPRTDDADEGAARGPRLEPHRLGIDRPRFGRLSGRLALVLDATGEPEPQDETGGEK